MPSPNPSPYGAKASAMIAARLTHAQREQVVLCAAAHNLTVGELTRRAITRLAAVELGKPYEDPQGVADDLRAALGLPPEAEPAEIAIAVSELIDELLALDGLAPADAPPADPLAGGAEPLSESQREALAKRGLPETPAAWAQLCSIAVRLAADRPARAARAAQPIGLSKEQQAACKRRGQPATPEGWRAVLARAARRPK